MSDSVVKANRTPVTQQPSVGGQGSAALNPDRNSKTSSSFIHKLIKVCPLLLVAIAIILLSDLALASVLVLDYFILDPVIRWLIHQIYPNFHLPGDCIAMHGIILTYVLLAYLRQTSRAHEKPSIYGLASRLSDNKMAIALLLILFLTITTIYHSRHTRAEIAVALIVGTIIGLFLYLFTQ